MIIDFEKVKNKKIIDEIENCKDSDMYRSAWSTVRKESLFFLTPDDFAAYMTFYSVIFRNFGEAECRTLVREYIDSSDEEIDQ